MSIRSQVAILISVAFFLLPVRTMASTYGSGSYGSGLYGGATAPSTAGTGIPDAGCTQSKPGSAPWLYGAVAQSKTSVLLYFTDSADPVDHYVLEYGRKSGEYPWGASDIGKKGARTYLVQSLTPNTIYYFRVRGGNGCASGAWSNEISMKTTVNGVISWLTARSVRPNPESIPVEGPAPSSFQTLTTPIPTPTTRIEESKPAKVETSISQPSLRVVVGLIAGGSIIITGTLFFLQRRKNG